MPTQKNCTDLLKKWQDASSMQEAVDAAKLCAKEFDGLYEESAMNLLGRTPELMLLLSAFRAGMEVQHELTKAEATSVQETLA